MVKNGLEDPDSAAAIRRRQAGFPVSYQTQVGRKLQDDGMRKHYERIMRQNHEIDTSEPSDAHYLHLAAWAASPSFKKTPTDQHVYDFNEKHRLAGLAKTRPQTDSTAPLVMYTNKAARDKYRRRVQQLPGFINSGAYEIQWSMHEEHHALNHLARHGRAISLQRGWTDHGPPEEAMAYRKFRRTFREAAILDMPPPKGMYMSAYEKSRTPSWSSQKSARAHLSREERAKIARAQTSQAKRRTAQHSHLNQGEHVPISAAMHGEEDGVEPAAEFSQSLLPKRRLGTAQSWLRTNKSPKANTHAAATASEPKLQSEATVRASSEVAIHSDITVGDEEEVANTFD